jgi:uncharacterized damage-inducible protein DinB
MKAGRSLLLAFAVALVWVGAQNAEAQSGLLAPIKAQWDSGRALVTNMAEFIPEDKYDFKPTPEVRSFREQLSHLVGENYMFASMAAGEPNPMPGDKVKALQTKADIVKALRESYEYGDKVWAGMSEAKALESIKLMGADSTRLRALLFQIVDNMDHYGNLVVYVRLNGMVPPRSAPKPGAAK